MPKHPINFEKAKPPKFTTKTSTVLTVDGTVAGPVRQVGQKRRKKKETGGKIRTTTTKS